MGASEPTFALAVLSLLLGLGLAALAESGWLVITTSALLAVLGVTLVLALLQAPRRMADVGGPARGTLVGAVEGRHPGTGADRSPLRAPLLPAYPADEGVTMS